MKSLVNLAIKNPDKYKFCSNCQAINPTKNDRCRKCHQTDFGKIHPKDTDSLVKSALKGLSKDLLLLVYFYDNLSENNNAEIPEIDITRRFPPWGNINPNLNKLINFKLVSKSKTKGADAKRGESRNFYKLNKDKLPLVNEILKSNINAFSTALSFLNADIREDLDGLLQDLPNELEDAFIKLGIRMAPENFNAIVKRITSFFEENI